VSIFAALDGTHNQDTLALPLLTTPQVLVIGWLLNRLTG